MAIEIGGIKLNKIHRIETLESGSYVYHKVAGLEGNVSQDLGRDSVKIMIEGIFYGPEALDDLEKLRKIYTEREAVNFLADVTGQAYAANVKIDTMQVAESAKFQNQFSYSLIITEYVEPPASENGFGGVDDMVGLDASLNMDIMELPDMLNMGAIPEISNPVEPLKGALEPVSKAAAEFTETAGKLNSLLKTLK